MAAETRRRTVSPEDIDYAKDVLIEEQQPIFSVRQDFYYARIISETARQISMNRQRDPLWTPDRLRQPATRIVDILQTHRSGGRFILVRHGPDFIMAILNREEAILKIQHDLNLKLQTTELKIETQKPRTQSIAAAMTKASARRCVHPESRQPLSDSNFVSKGKSNQSTGQAHPFAALQTTLNNSYGNNQAMLHQSQSLPPLIQGATVLGYPRLYTQPFLSRNSSSSLMLHHRHHSSVDTPDNNLADASTKNPKQHVDSKTIHPPSSKMQQTSTVLVTHDSDPTLPNARRNPQLEYGIRLVLAVCHAEQVEQVRQATRVLDKNPWKRKGPVSPASFQETPNQRKLRLLLRQRYMAAAESGLSTYDFSVALLKGWGVNVAPTFRRPKHNNKKKSPMLKNAPVLSKQNQLNEITGSDGIVQSLPPQRENQNTISTQVLQSSVNDHSNNNVNVEIKTKTEHLGKHVDGLSNTGQWNAEERRAFLLAFESYGVGCWAGIANYVPTRSLEQVKRFGRSVASKFSLKKGDLPTDDCRDYLLKGSS